MPRFLSDIAMYIFTKKSIFRTDTYVVACGTFLEVAGQIQPKAPICLFDKGAY